MTDNVNSPSHYQHPSGIEVISITSHESFLRGNILKYVLRAPYKGSELEDLKKARKYLDWEIERVEHHARHDEALSRTATELQERINRMHDKEFRDRFAWRVTHEFNTEEDRATR